MLSGNCVYIYYVNWNYTVSGHSGLSLLKAKEEERTAFVSLAKTRLVTASTEARSSGYHTWWRGDLPHTSEVACGIRPDSCGARPRGERPRKATPLGTTEKKKKKPDRRNNARQNITQPLGSPPSSGSQLQRNPLAERERGKSSGCCVLTGTRENTALSYPPIGKGGKGKEQRQGRAR